MPLYRKRPKKLFLSQDVPTKKTTPFKQPNSSQKAIKDILESHRDIKSPIYPEVFPRNASEPNESACDNFILEEENVNVEQKLSPEVCEINVSQNFSESEMENSEMLIADKNESEIISVDNDPSSTVKLSQTKEEKVSIRKINDKKKNSKKSQSSITNADKKKIKLLDFRDETSNDDIFSQISIESKLTDKQPKNSLCSRELDISLTSSVSSQISINHPPVKEAFKNFMRKKETKKKNIIASQNSDISLNDPLMRETYTQFLTKKEKFSRVDTPNGLTHYDKMKWLQQQRVVGVYVHCDKCDKIRYLEEIEDPTLLPNKWYCENNRDKEFNNCEIPEEKFPAHIQEDWIDNLYNAGSLVWAKVEGYPWWPAMVEDDPNTESYYWLDDEINNTPSYYHVTFFDKKEVTRAWLKPHDIKSFYKDRNDPKLYPNKFSIFKERLDYAINQANDALNMSLKKRLEKFSFLTRYQKPIKKPKDIKEDLKKKKFKRDANIKSKSSRVKISNETLQRRRKMKKKDKKFQTCDFLIGDFEIPSSPAIENISLEMFEDI